MDKRIEMLEKRIAVLEASQRAVEVFLDQVSDDMSSQDQLLADLASAVGDVLDEQVMSSSVRSLGC